MATETSSIDDLLGGMGNATTPKAPEFQPDFSEEMDTSGVEEVTTPASSYEEEPETANEEESSEPEAASLDIDEYGNKQPEENEVIRERLARQAESMRRKHEQEMQALRAELTSSQNQKVQQAAEDFEYDPNAEGDWLQQLRGVIKETVKSLSQEEQQERVAQQQQQADMEFRGKFEQGMDRYHDYVEVVDSQPMTPAMVNATRGMNDPAAFIYAAAKRAPEDLARISQLRDPYAQMAEMIRLEERMRKSRPATTAPRPMARTKENAPMTHNSKSNKGDSIEDLIASSDAKRMAMAKQRYAR